MPVDVLTEIVIARSRDEVAAFAGDPSNAPKWYVNIRSVEWKTNPPIAVGSQMAFVAQFLGRRLAYTYRIVELVAGERLVMRTAKGPFPMETTYTWKASGRRFGMKASKRKRLEERGWAVGGAKEFLGITDAEAAIIEFRLNLAESLKVLRQRKALSQHELAQRLGSSQSRVAKMEAGDASVSIELLLRALLSLGTTRQQLGRMISRAA